MARRSFFFLALANSILLTLIFVVRWKNLSLIESTGWVYLLLAIPAVYLFRQVGAEPNATRYRVVLAIFLAYLLAEGLLDMALKVEFRDNWPILGPYIALYDVMNLGFISAVWKDSRKKGILMLVLFILQLVTNLSTH